MTIVDWPAGLTLSAQGEGVCRLVYDEQEVRNTDGIVVQVVRRRHRNRWVQDGTLIVRPSDHYRLEVVREALQGMVNSLSAPDFYHQADEFFGDGTGGDEESTFVDGTFDDAEAFGADYGLALTLTANAAVRDTGFPVVDANQASLTALKAGARISVGGRLHRLTADLALNASGVGTAQFEPPLRKDVSSGATITTFEPRGLWVATEFQPVATLPTGQREWTINLEEDLR